MERHGASGGGGQFGGIPEVVRMHVGVQNQREVADANANCGASVRQLFRFARRSRIDENRSVADEQVGLGKTETDWMNGGHGTDSRRRE